LYPGMMSVLEYVDVDLRCVDLGMS
jgi:hypothetical protein